MKSKIFATLICVFVALSAFAQNRVTGVVKDNIGPLAGASVVELGTKNGVVTDQNGNFTISVKPGATLEIACLGYETQLIPVGNRSQFDITLEEDKEMLDEVVVTALGIAKESKKLGYSVATIKADDRPLR